MADSANWELWVDRGGTFTDVVVRSPNGQVSVHKLLSECPEQYRDAVLEAKRRYIPENAQLKRIKMGTTVATNALLERQGQPTVLVVTQGLADALHIGHQTRPDLFALNIKKPRPLSEHVIEAKERLDAAGNVVVPLDSNAVKSALSTAFKQGYRSVAVVLMHSYRNHHHEQEIAAIAQALGYTQISTSADISPVMKLIGRGNTTAVDAYLTPVIRRYVDGLKADLGNTELLLMQSNGGLCDTDHFRGKNSILSGPAGGVVGAVQSAKTAGFQRIIGFDMGGTSTDVSHYAGTYERTYDTEIAGVQLTAPMMAVHTVAAGGGSIVHYDNGRYTVGPDSAGATPGPMCYRRGGPLTVTDCNVMLGKIQPEFFPKVFGPDANEPIDVNAVKNAFESLAKTVGKSASEVAHDVIDVAVSTMARAIKNISVDQGHNVTNYALCCFGGAAGQHACLVADAMDIPTVFIHPYAGVLSAWGMGLAQQRALKEQGVETSLDADSIPNLNTILATLEQSALSELPTASQTVQRIHLRYAGTDTALVVNMGTLEQLVERFEVAHKAKYGFVYPDKGLVIETAAVEVVTSHLPLTSQRTKPQGEATPTAHFTMFSDNAHRQVPLYQRHDLPNGAHIVGPAIIADETGTTVVEHQWNATVREGGELVLNRLSPQTRQTLSTGVDPMMLTIFNHRFMSVAEQMGVVLEHTAHSVNIKERRDYSCAVFDAVGRLVANAPHIPVHLGSMGQSVKALIANAEITVTPGDVYAINDPYNGGTHLPDITVVSPIFVGQTEQPLFWVASRGHHADVGGITPGSMPPHSTTIEDEGVLLTHVPLVRNGHFDEAHVRSLFASARNPEQNVADLRAQIAANTRGKAQLIALVDEFGLAVVQAYMDHIRNHASACVRALLTTLESGHFECLTDENQRIRVSVSVDKNSQSAVIDFTGTSPQSSGNANAPKAVCHAVVLYVFRALTGAEIPLNDGCLEPLEIVIPKGCLLDPTPPAAVVAGNVETSQIVADALLGAVGALAGSQGTMNNLTFGNSNHQYYETLCGGAGAGPDFSGADAVHTHMTNSRLTDPEVLEWRYPVRLEQFCVRQDSGGAGRYSGGHGAIRRLRFLEPMTVSMLSDRRKVAPHGLAGGRPGKTGNNILIRADGTEETLGGRATVSVNADDQLLIETPGGGGYGKPLPQMNRWSTWVHSALALGLIGLMVYALLGRDKVAYIQAPSVTATRFVDRNLELETAWNDLLTQYGMSVKIEASSSPWSETVAAYTDAIEAELKRATPAASKSKEQLVYSVRARLAILHHYLGDSALAQAQLEQLPEDWGAIKVALGYGGTANPRTALSLIPYGWEHHQLVRVIANDDRPFSNEYLDKAKQRLMPIIWVTLIFAFCLLIGLALLVRWFRRGRPPLHQPHSSAIGGWPVSTGIGVGSRGLIWGLLLVGAISSLPLLGKWAGLWGTLITGLPILWLLKRYIGDNQWRTLFQRIGLTALPAKTLIGVVLVTLTLDAAGAYLINELGQLLGYTQHWSDGIIEAFIWDPKVNVLMLIVEITVWAPIFEELGFRGLLYGTLRSRLSATHAILLSAFLFAIVHPYSLPGIMSIMWSGSIYAVCYEKTRSLWPGIVAHLVHNAMVTTIFLLAFR